MKLRQLAFALTVIWQSHVSGAETNAVDPAHLAYNLKTTVQAYDKVGSKNQKWNAAAQRCLTTFANIRSLNNGNPSELIKELQTNLTHLVGLKCDDPLIHYLYVRFAFSASHSATENATAFGEAASALEKSQYPDIRKFYAAMWACSALVSSDPKRPQIVSMLETASSSLAKALADKTVPLQEVDQACDLIMSAPWWADSRESAPGAPGCQPRAVHRS